MWWYCTWTRFLQIGAVGGWWVTTPVLELVCCAYQKRHSSSVKQHDGRPSRSSVRRVRRRHRPDHKRIKSRTRRRLRVELPHVYLAAKTRFGRWCPTHSPPVRFSIDTSARLSLTLSWTTGPRQTRRYRTKPQTCKPQAWMVHGVPSVPDGAETRHVNGPKVSPGTHPTSDRTPPPPSKTAKHDDMCTHNDHCVLAMHTNCARLTAGSCCSRLLFFAAIRHASGRESLFLALSEDGWWAENEVRV